MGRRTVGSHPRPFVHLALSCPLPLFRAILPPSRPPHRWQRPESALHLSLRPPSRLHRREGGQSLQTSCLPACSAGGSRASCSSAVSSASVTIAMGRRPLRRQRPVVQIDLLIRAQTWIVSAQSGASRRRRLGAGEACHQPATCAPPTNLRETNLQNGRRSSTSLRKISARSTNLQNSAPPTCDTAPPTCEPPSISDLRTPTNLLKSCHQPAKMSSSTTSLNLRPKLHQPARPLYLLHALFFPMII